MKNWIVFLCIGLLALSGCKDDDENITPLITYDLPEWQENIEFVPTTNVPAVQIDRFVAANNLDTVMTPSGLVYVILDPGGDEKPTRESEIVAWYRGYLTDGTIFDQSTDRPFAALLSRMIEGWQEGIPQLGKGGKMWMLVRPSLAYGNAPPATAPAITTRTVLVFEIELADFE